MPRRFTDRHWSERASNCYWCYGYRIEATFYLPLHPWTPASASRRHRTPPTAGQIRTALKSGHALLERECLLSHLVGTFTEAYRVMPRWTHDYETVRYHGSLQDRSPAECYR